MPRGDPYKYTKEQIIEAFRLRDQGLPRAEITERTGVDPPAMSKFFRGLIKWFNPKDYGFELSIPKREQADLVLSKYKDAYISLWGEGLSHRLICEELDIPKEHQQRISSHLYDYGLIERRINRSSKRKPRPVKPEASDMGIPILSNRIPTQDTGIYRVKKLLPVKETPQKDSALTIKKKVAKDNQARDRERFVDDLCSAYLAEVPIAQIALDNNTTTREVRQILISEGYIK